MEKQNVRDVNVELLRVIACLIVIGTHVKLNDLPSVMPGNQIDISRTVIGGFLGEGVTIFLVITGFFFLENKSFCKLVKKTVKTIIVPTLLYLIVSQIFCGWITGTKTLMECVRNPEIQWNEFSSLLSWSFGKLPMTGHLWYIMMHIQIVLWFPLIRLLRGEAENVNRIRRYIMGVSIIAVLLIDLQKIIILPLGKVGGYTIIPTYILLILTGYELYERREAIQSNKKYGFIGIVMYFLAHAALTFLQIMLYKRDYNTGHVFSWDSSFAIIGAVGLSVFCLSLSIERRMTQKIIRFLGKYTFPVYLVHLLVIRKANSSLIWKKLFALSERGIFGELCYTVIAIFYVFLISLVVVMLVTMVVALIKKGLNLHRE